MAKKENNVLRNRFEWAASIIAPAANDHILEIGCGAGFLAELVAIPLTNGKLTAIDSSDSMIRKAGKRNQAAIARGKLALQTLSFSESEFRRPFNKIVAFNVNIFWKNPNNEVSLVRKLLASEGQLFVFYQTPSGIDRSLMKKIEAMLTSQGFTVRKTHVESKEPVRSFAVIASVIP